jgi:hypothetical protein
VVRHQQHQLWARGERRSSTVPDQPLSGEPDQHATTYQDGPGAGEPAGDATPAAEQDLPVAEQAPQDQVQKMACADDLTSRKGGDA